MDNIINIRELIVRRRTSVVAPIVVVTKKTDIEECAGFGNCHTAEADACIECKKTDSMLEKRCMHETNKKVRELNQAVDVGKWLKENKDTPKRIGKKLHE